MRSTWRLGVEVYSYRFTRTEIVRNAILRQLRELPLLAGPEPPHARLTHVIHADPLEPPK